MMKKATFGQRAGAVLIDFLIIGIISFISIVIMQSIVLVEMPNELIELTDLFANADISYQQFVEEMQDLMLLPSVAKYYNSVYLSFGLGVLFVFIYYCLYFIGLPSLWKKGQTIGRYAMKVQVLDEDQSGYRTSTMVVREIVGGFLLSVLLNCCCCIPLIVNLILLSRGKSIADAVGRSDMFSTVFKDEEFDISEDNIINYSETKQNVKDEFHFDESPKDDKE